MVNLSTLLVPTDFSETSEQAVTYAQALRERFDSTLHLLTRLQHPTTPPWGSEAYWVSRSNHPNAMG